MFHALLSARVELLHPKSKIASVIAVRSIFSVLILLNLGGCKESRLISQDRDTIPPLIRVISPENGAIVVGAVVVRVSATDNVGVEQVEVLINGEIKATLTSEPYYYYWNTGSYNGECIIRAEGQDAAGNTGVSPTLTVTARNTGTIGGLVRDAVSGGPLSGVSVVVTHQATQATTDSSGSFLLSDVPVNSQVVTATKGGYNPNSATVQVRSADTTWINIELIPLSGESHDPAEERDFPLGNTGQTIRMCWIPAGWLEMGSPESEKDRGNDEGPVHQVIFLRGYWISKYEVTQSQWEAVLGNNPASGYGVGDDYPVYSVSWDDVQSFESRLASQGDTFRLPSEAQWEYACRAGTATRFYWGDDPRYTSIGLYAWYDDNSTNQTHQVGTAGGRDGHPNAWGVSDPSGNVWEWCEDWYHDSYVGAPKDGSAWTSGGGTKRLLRGGSWNSFNNLCRSASRAKLIPSLRSTSAGFRVVLMP